MKSNYIFSKTIQINNQLKHLCDTLFHNCCTADNLKHPCCFEDEFDFFPNSPRLYYATFENQLIGFLSVYIIDENSVEICMFVQPDNRGKHIGRQLLNNFFSDYAGTNIEVSLHPDNQLGIHFLEKNNFVLASTELLMSMSFDLFISQNINVKKFCQNISLQKTGTDSSIQYQCFFDNQCIGSCNISLFSDTYIFISNVEISEQHRGMGLGYQFMLKVLQELSSSFHNILLHVSKENLPAYKLYQKLGFEISESTLIYTLYKE